MSNSLFYYQPIVILNDQVRTGNLYNSTVAYEALLREHRALEKITSPEAILIYLEQHNQKKAFLKELVQDNLQAAKKLSEFHARCIKVHINLDPHDLTQSFLDFIASYASAKDFLVLEITERDNVNPAIESSINALSCAIALDDFGEQYAVLSRILNPNISLVKLSKDFLAKANVSTLKLVGDLARSNSKISVVEGIEVVEQLYLSALAGIDYGQGYHIARPRALETWIEKEPLTGN